MNIYFNGVWRMDWGLGNPNKTATLIAMLMISSWSLTYIRKWGFWVALSCFTALGMCLTHTVSRGGLLAVCSGCAVLIWKLPRPWNAQRLIGVITGILLIIVSSIYLQTYSRYGQGITEEDLSITNRFRVWESAPSMMVDAPNGWGIGNSGRAYMQWYQPIDHHETYRTLVNSHLTWLVEFSWPLRFLYLLGWFSILMLCWPREKELFSAIPCAIWIAFGVGAYFSSIAESIWMWIIPVVGLSAVLYRRFVGKRWPTLGTWGLPIALSMLVLMILFAAGINNRKYQIHGSTNEVILGDNNPKIWIIVDSHVLGSNYGRALRQDLSPYSVGFVTPTGLSTSLKGDTLVICGTLKKEELQEIDSVAANFHRILLINPTFYPQEIKINGSVQVSAIFGELSQSSSINEWKLHLGKQVSILPGIADFIPNWPVLLSDFK